jgi:hypothetical protein
MNTNVLVNCLGDVCLVFMPHFVPGTCAVAQSTQAVQVVCSAQYPAQAGVTEGVTVDSTVEFIREHYDSLFRRLAD